jgi:ParB family transcriptional regulator, chromosome partitioning protein
MTGIQALERIAPGPPMMPGKTAPVHCVVRAPSVDVAAEKDSLAENVHRASPHPLDQLRAFQSLRQRGQSEKEIAAAFCRGAAIRDRAVISFDKVSDKPPPGDQG